MITHGTGLSLVKLWPIVTFLFDEEEHEDKNDDKEEEEEKDEEEEEDDQEGVCISTKCECA